MGLLQRFAALAVVSAIAACDSKPSFRPPLEEARRARREEAPASRLPMERLGGLTKQRQADFLNRIRAADPEGKTIDRALINDQNELGLILDRSVQLDDIPKLMKGLLTQMAREFPGEDLTIVAYTPSNPPRKIGTGRLNARTRDLTYTPET